jgi:biopolymer transport protein ExbB/TolQ
MMLLAALILWPFTCVAIIYAAYRIYKHIDAVREEQLKEQRLNDAFNREQQRRKPF